LNSLKTNLNNLQSNKLDYSNLTYDSNINTLLSQLENLETANKTIADQIT
jgi:hypothetical protein